jgi:iron complex transport system permease protein
MEKYRLTLILLIIGIVLTAILSLLTGPVVLGPGALWDSLSGEADARARLIFFELRVPRTLLALVVGAALGMCGAMLQGWLRNPLADPGLFGTTACASFGGALSIHTGLYAVSILALPLCGITGALIGAAFVMLLVGSRQGMLTMVLAGIALQSLAGAMTALLLNLAPNPHTALEIAFWLLGSVSDRSMTEVWLSVPLIVVGMAMALKSRRALDALALGEDTAVSLGVHLKRTQWLVMGATALSVGPAAAATGSIAFIGLIVPHMLRPLIGAQPGRLLIPSALAGALLLLSADIGVRLLPSSSEIKLGVVTSLLGAPFFLMLLSRSRGKWL